MWIVEIFRLSVDSSCGLLVYMTILWIVLTAIISRFDRQLLGNKLSFAPCSMYILFNSNKFHKFWMSCACRNSLSKDGRN